MEEIKRSLALLHTSQPGSNEQKEANTKLLSLQRENEAWRVSFQLISSSPNFQIQLFGAQTLILKIHEHWSSLGASEKAKVPPALLSQIHSYLSQGKVANQGGNVVMEKLTKAYAASCVRTFPLSYPSFVSDVSNLLSASPQNPPLLRAVIDIFRHFPEEMSIVHISSNQRGNMETQFLSQASEKLISIGRFCLLERGRDGGEWEGVRASIFMCMGIWLESLAVGEDLIQALFGFIPAAVQAIVAEGGQGENEGALEFLLAYFSVLPASDVNTFQEVLTKISPLFEKYEKNKNDEETCLDLMRVFVRVSSQFCPLFLSSSVSSLPPVVRSLLGAILDGTVGESSSVSTIGLEFWKSFGRAAADSSFPSSSSLFTSASLSSSCPEKSSSSSSSSAVAAEYFQALLPSLLKKCTYPEGFEPKEGGVPLLLTGNDPSDFDYSDFKIYRDSASVVLKQGADSIGLDSFFSLLSSHLSISSSNWRMLESVVFATNCIIKLLLAYTNSPSSSATSFSLSSSLGSSPTAAPLPLPPPFLEILHQAISSPVFPLLTITSLKLVGNFGSLFSGQFEMGGKELAFRTVAFMFEAMKIPALVSGACDAFKKVTTHAAQWLLPHCQSILEHSFSNELHHLSKFPQAKTDLFTGVVAVLRAATPEQIMGAMEGIVPAFGASLTKLVEQSSCLHQQAHGHMEELKLAMVQEEVEVAVVEELRVVKAVVEAMEGVGGGRIVAGLWPLLKEVGLRWRGSEDVVESFSSLCVSILQMCPLPSPQQLQTEEGREQGRVMEEVMKDMVSYFMTSYEEYYFACCLVVLSSLLKERFCVIKKRGGEGGEEVVQQWRTLCESCIRLSYSYVEICGNPEGEVDLIKGVFDFLYCTISTTKGEALPHTVVPLVVQLSGVALPFANRECLRSIVSTLSALVSLRSRPSPPANLNQHSKLLWEMWDSMWLGEGGGEQRGGAVMKNCFFLLPTAFQLNATRRIAGLLRSLMLSYPEKRNMWIEQGINLFDEGLFRDFGKPRTANAFLSCLQHERKFNVFMSDFGRVLNQEVDDSVLIAYEVPS